MHGGLYFHIPFCTRRCPYCDFTLIESDGSLHGPVTARMVREIREQQADFRVTSAYFGGGTPSMLESESLKELMDASREQFQWQDNTEVTLEANPEDVTRDRLAAWKNLGINRLSLGIQAWDEPSLRFLGREHTGETARTAFTDARDAGFDNINIDLIFGLPDDSTERWWKTIEFATALRPDHISLYGLTYEKGTPITRKRDAGEKPGIDDDSFSRLYRLAMNRLPERGYRQYEISNFAKPGRESVHNRIYWDRRPYLGFGPGAHSFIPETRWWNLSNVRQYPNAKDIVWKRESLSAEQQSLERVMLGMRTVEGMALDHPSVAALKDEGLVELVDGRVRLTPDGRCLSDSVIERLS